MQNSAWIGLLRLIPPDHHDRLILMTVNCTEINIAGILRAERDFLVVRGRLAACTEAGRLFIIPYDQISHLGFRDGVEEAKVVAMFAAAPALSGAGLSRIRTQGASGSRSERKQEPSTEPDSPGAAPETMNSLDRQPPAKAAILERLRRTRLGQEPSRSSET